MTKPCTKCGAVKPYEDFHKLRLGIGGRATQCRVCMNAIKRERWHGDPKRAQRNEAMRLRAEVRRIADPDAERRRKAAWIAVPENRAKRNACARALYASDPDVREASREYGRRFRVEKPAIVAAANRRYLSRKRGAPVSNLTYAEWAATLEEYGGRCAYCARIAPLEQDHFVPLSGGGDHTADNVVPACRSCNASKNDKPFLFWLASRPACFTSDYALAA